MNRGRTGDITHSNIAHFVEILLQVDYEHDSRDIWENNLLYKKKKKKSAF